MAAAPETGLTVLDASALLALLLDEPGRADVEALMRRHPPPVISAVNLAEVIDKLVRGRGANAEQVNDAIDLLIVGGLEVLPFWLPQARNAAAIARALLRPREFAAVAGRLRLPGDGPFRARRRRDDRPGACPRSPGFGRRGRRLSGFDGTATRILTAVGLLRPSRVAYSGGR